MNKTRAEKSIRAGMKEVMSFKKDKDKEKFNSIDESKNKWDKWIKDLDMNRAIDLAKKSSKYNEKGEVVLSKDDEWREDNEWNKYYDDL